MSADEEDVREFCEALSVDTPGFDGGEASELLLGPGAGTCTVPPPAAPEATASSNCHAAHPPRDTAVLRRRVTAVHTRNRLLRVLALRPDSELRLLQWRLADTHATINYFGAEARLNFQ